MRPALGPISGIDFVCSSWKRRAKPLYHIVNNKRATFWEERIPLQNSGAGTHSPRRRREPANSNVYNLALCALLFASPWLFGFAREVARVDRVFGTATHHPSRPPRLEIDETRVSAA